MKRAGQAQRGRRHLEGHEVPLRVNPEVAKEMKAKFLEELVVPFLNGQEFYSTNGYWPWDEYAHGITGLLESYSIHSAVDPKATRDLLRILSTQKSWSRLRNVLQQQKIQRHTICFCDAPDLIRRCHPNALAGLRLLHKRIKMESITLP